MVLTVIFWVLWFLWLIGFFFGWEPKSAPSRAHGAIPAILIGILGLKAFGSPLDK